MALPRQRAPGFFFGETVSTALSLGAFELYICQASLHARTRIQVYAKAAPTSSRRPAPAHSCCKLCPMVGSACRTSQTPHRRAGPRDARLCARNICAHESAHYVFCVSTRAAMPTQVPPLSFSSGHLLNSTTSRSWTSSITGAP